VEGCRGGWIETRREKKKKESTSRSIISKILFSIKSGGHRPTPESCQRGRCGGGGGPTVAIFPNFAHLIARLRALGVGLAGEASVRSVALMLIWGWVAAATGEIRGRRKKVKKVEKGTT